MRKYTICLFALLSILVLWDRGQAFATLSESSATPTTLAATPTPDPKAAYDLGGYADQVSVIQGRPITFHIATDISPFELKIVNAADSSQVLTNLLNLTSAPQDCAGKYDRGCDWTTTTTFTVPAAWPSGYYIAKFSTSRGDQNVVFVVKSATPGASSPILMVSATNTYQAYNAYGSKSVYDRGSTDNKRSSQVSFNRPYLQNAGMGDLPAWELPFIRWMKGQNRLFEMAADSDLEDPNLLDHYKLVLIVGHSEYWSSTMRRNLEQYSQAGGHVAIFGGNTMWWQIRWSDDQRTMIVYKDASQDSMTGEENSLVTVNWYDWPVNNPENLIVGASFRWAGYANQANKAYDLLPTDQRAPYTVVEADNWLLQGAGLKPGDTFGKAAAGLETDGALYNCDSNGQSPRVEGSDGTPLNYHILATVPGSNGHGTIGLYTNVKGGVVFNAGTQGWTPALGVDPTITLITTRLLDKLSTGEPQPYDTVTSPYLTEDRFNCPQQVSPKFPGWRVQGQPSQADLSARCAYEGPAGVEMTNDGSKPTGLIRSLTPTDRLLSKVYTRFYLNADALHMNDNTTTTINIIDLRHSVQYNVDPKLRVQLKTSLGGNMIRIQEISEGGGTSWVPLGKGWQAVEVGWESPGSIRLWLNGTVSGTINNAAANQGVNEVRLTFSEDKPVPSDGYLCFDSFAASGTPIAVK